MVKLFSNINQNDLPTIATASNETLDSIDNNCNSKKGIVYPLPRWCSSDSFDYQQYYNKKKGLSTIKHAKSISNNKPKQDENFKIDINNENFFNFTDYQTLFNVSKYNYLVNPYCNHDVEADVEDVNLYQKTIDKEGIKGRLSTTPYLDETNKLSVNKLNKIKGNISYEKCLKFKYGFKPKVQNNEVAQN